MVDRDPLRALDLRPRDAAGRRRASDVSDRLERRLAGDPRCARAGARDSATRAQTDAALAAYEAERRPATTQIVLLNRQNGPEQVMQMVEERAPDGFDDRHRRAVASRSWKTSPRITRRVAGFQVEALNAKPPIVPAPP